MGDGCLGPGRPGPPGIDYHVQDFNPAANRLRVNLLAGQAEPVGFFSSRNQVIDLAIPLDQR